MYLHNTGPFPPPPLKKMKATLHWATLWALPTLLASLAVLLAMEMLVTAVQGLASAAGMPQVARLLERLVGGKQIPSFTALMLGSMLVAMVSCSISLHKLVLLKTAEVEHLRKRR